MPILGVVASQISGHLISPYSPTGSYNALAVYTVPSGGASSITFAGIPQSGYQHLQIRGIARYSFADANTGLVFTFNSDSGNNYSFHQLRGDGSTTYAGASPSTTYGLGGVAIANSSLANSYTGAVIDILDYTSTNKYKTVRSLSGYDANGSGFINFCSSLWMNTNAITSISIFSSQSYNLAQYSQFALYGIRG